MAQGRESAKFCRKVLINWKTGLITEALQRESASLQRGRIVGKRQKVRRFWRLTDFWGTKRDLELLQVFRQCLSLASITLCNRRKALDARQGAHKKCVPLFIQVPPCTRVLNSPKGHKKKSSALRCPENRCQETEAQ